MNAAINAEDLLVQFPIYENSHRSLKNKVLNISTGGRIGSDAAKHPVVKALDGLTFSIRHGERVGLSGHNGSGKTTLLRVLSGVYSPVRGRISVTGKIASLLDVSMGLDPDATGYENIYLRGLIDGLKPAAIREKVDEIAEFTGLGDYLDLPVRTYSSGMMVRLAFAISTNIEADVLLMDEWLSVGDADFRAKATDRLDSIVSKASILVIASHDPTLIERMCTRKIHLEHGQIVSDEPVIRQVMAKRTADGEVSPENEPRRGQLNDPWVVRKAIEDHEGQPRELIYTEGAQPGDGVAKLVSCRLTDAAGQAISSVLTSETFYLEVTYRVLREGKSLRPGCILTDEASNALFWTIDSDPALVAETTPLGVYRARAEIPGHLLAPGILQFSFAVGDAKLSLSHAVAPLILPIEVKDDLQDDLVRGGFRGNLPGVIRPKLSWKTEQISRGV